MVNMVEIQKMVTELPPVFWKTFDFWIFVALSSLSLLFAILAFIEAKAAKKAANKAGQTVKIQTITIELTEIIQKLDILEPTIEFSQARDFYSEINRRIRRLISPFKNEANYQESITIICSTLDALHESLSKVRPIENKNIVDNSIYFAIEHHFSMLSGQLAELMGYFEERTINKDF